MNAEESRLENFGREYDQFEPLEESLREALTSTGNGYFCTRGAAEWKDAGGIHYPGTYVHGGYNCEPTVEYSTYPTRTSGSRCTRRTNSGW